MADALIASWLEGIRAVTTLKDLQVLLYSIGRVLQATSQRAWLVWLSLFLASCFVPNLLLDTIFIHFLIFCAVRPSVTLKTWSYFIFRILYYFYIYLVLACALQLVAYLVSVVISQFIPVMPVSLVNITSFLFKLHAGGFLSLSLLFLLDTYPKNGIQALRQAVVFFYYNYPVTLGIQLLYLVLEQLATNFIMYFFAPYFCSAKLTQYALFFLYAAVLSTFYTKRLYEQLKLYYDFK